MPTNRETGKDRWGRIPKDYFKTLDGLQSVKLRLSGLACVAAVAWWAVGVGWPGREASSTDLNSLRGNHGTLARVHATWDAKCDACHVPFQPIDGRPLFASRSTASDRASDTLCMSCHAGPAHHASMIESEVKGCAECHRDHQGRDFSLVRLADTECTNCHAALDAHIDTRKRDPKSKNFGRVARFDVKDHPAFAPEAASKVGDRLEDKGKLKFNHALHMMPGLVRTLGDTPYRVENIPIASERARYQGSGTAQDPVRLDCASCHRLDSTEITAAANPAVPSFSFPPRSPGRYYLPTTFENDCRGCHALSFDPRMKDVEAPHGVQPDEVAAFVRRTYASQILSDDPKVLDVFVPAVRLPGKSRVDSTAKARLDDSVAKALTFLFSNGEAAPSLEQVADRNNCLECHHYGPERSAGFPNRVEPTKVPEVWFTHASFDHSAHRGVSCRDCHARSYALDPDGKTPFAGASRVSTDVLIPAIDNCVQCHAPARVPGRWFAAAESKPIGGASFDCTECHRYHNGDQPLQGVGATAQDATIDRGVAAFLQGLPPAAKSPDP